MLKTFYRKQFVETAILLIDWWVESFPSPAAKEQRAKLRGIVSGNVEREHTLVAQWHSTMQQPLPKSVPYAAALRRILEEDGVLYHVCEYRDMPTFLAGDAQIDVLRALNTEENLNARPELKGVLWDIVLLMNTHALRYHEMPTLRVPTPKEIKANIASHKASRIPPKPAMPRGFDAVYDELAAHLKLDLGHADGSELEAWTTAIKEHKIGDAVLRHDQAAVCAVPLSSSPLHVALVAAAEQEAFDERTWDLLAQLNTYAGVSSSIGPGMMGRIENTAHRLAGDIAAGKTDLSSINLAQIGQSVLEGCDASEVQQLAGDVNSLLPMLQTLQKSFTPAPP